MSKQDSWEIYNRFVGIIQNNDHSSFENMVDSGADINTKDDEVSESLFYTITVYHKTEMLKFLFNKQILVTQSQLVKSFANQARVMNCYSISSVDENIDKYIKTIDLLATQIKDINGKFFLNDQVGEVTILQYMVLLQSTGVYHRGFDYVFTKLADKLSIEHIVDSMEINIQQSLIERSTRFPEFKITIDYLLQKLYENLKNYPEKNIVANQLVILKALSQSTADNSELIKLLAAKFSINWNEKIDQAGNNLLLSLAQKNDDFNLMNYIPLKNKNGLNIFQLNYCNDKGNKLIDIYSGKVHFDLNANHMIELLRINGSAEPKIPHVASNSSINIIDVHHMNNESLFKKTQSYLHKKHQNVKFDEVLNEIETFINNNKNLLEQRLGNEEYLGLNNNFIQLKDNIYKHNEHNNIYSSQEELAYVWLEASEQNKLDGMMSIICELNGCNWGQIINLYKLIEKTENYDEVEHTIDFNAIYGDSDAMTTIFHSAMESLYQAGISNENVQKLVYKFYQDIIKYRNDISKFSINSEIVLGAFNKILIELAEKSTGTKDIYTEDVKNFFGIIQYVVSEYDSEDQDATGNNLFYQLVSASEKGETFSNPFINSVEKNELCHQEDNLHEIILNISNLVDVNEDMQTLGDNF